MFTVLASRARKRSIDAGDAAIWMSPEKPLKTNHRQERCWTAKNVALPDTTSILTKQTPRNGAVPAAKSNDSTPSKTPNVSAASAAYAPTSTTYTNKPDNQLYKVMRTPKDKHSATCLRQIATSRKKGHRVMFKKPRKVKNGSLVKILRTEENDEGCFVEIVVLSSNDRSGKHKHRNRSKKKRKTGFLPRRYLQPFNTTLTKEIDTPPIARRESYVLDPIYPAGKIPKMLSALWAALLRHNGLKSEGILRRSAEKNQIQQVQFRMTKDLQTMSVQELSKLCPNALCAGNLIKLFFRNQSPRLLDAFDGGTLDQMVDEFTDQQFTAIIESTFGEHELNLFGWIMDRCLDIIQCNDTNRMSAEALAVVFAPNLFGNISTAIGQGNRFFGHAIMWRKRTFTDTHDRDSDSEDSTSDVDTGSGEAASKQTTPAAAAAAASASSE